MTDLFLSDLKTKYPKIKWKQSISKYYKKYNTRIRLDVTKGQSRFVQQSLYYHFEDIIVRKENCNLSIFFNMDEKLLIDIFNYLQNLGLSNSRFTAFDCIHEINYDSLDMKSKELILPKIKKQGFNFKVTMRTGGGIFSPEIKNTLLNIIQQDPDNFKITPETEKWLKDPIRCSNWYLKYIYVKSGSTVTFLNLACREIVDQVYEII